MASNSTRINKLYELVPTVYRERDAEQGYPLRGLLEIVQEQVGVLEKDIKGLWADSFIETCADWVVPYIGDLVGNRTLYGDNQQDTRDTARELFADLVGPTLLPPATVRTRADVAKTIYYRRRKGTLPMLEELARDVTGWPAHPVEFFERLGWTQNVNFQHIARHGLVDLRSVETVDRINGPFDELAHTIDIRSIRQGEGWYNIRNIGFFLWRVQSYALSRVPARSAPSDPTWRFHFSPLGNRIKLFSRWRREGDESGMVTEFHVPAPIRHALFYEDLKAYRNLDPPRPDDSNLYGLFERITGDSTESSPEASLSVVRNGKPVPLAADADAPTDTFVPQIVCRRLDPWPIAPPSGQVIAIDVQSGRLAVGDGWNDNTDQIDVDFLYGFCADLGGGPYSRSKWLTDDADAIYFYVKEDGVSVDGGPVVTHTSVEAALLDWAAGTRSDTVIVILDNRTYGLPSSLQLSNENRLTIEAADGVRPVLQTDGAGLQISALPPIRAGDPDRGASLTLSGVVVEGFLHITGDLGHLRLLHATLVPGRGLTEDGRPLVTEPSVTVDETDGSEPINTQLHVEIAFSICGSLRIPAHATGIWLLDTIVDGMDGVAIAAPDTGGSVPGPAAHIERSTVFGATAITKLTLASNSIFEGPLVVQQIQEGCTRFSYVPPGSRTPKRYRCQPDQEIKQQIAGAAEIAKSSGVPFGDAERAAISSEVEKWLVPDFEAKHYGHPAYAQLRLPAPCQIRGGADNESEMGAFCHLLQRQREANLRIRLDEYLPVGLDAGLIYVT